MPDTIEACIDFLHSIAKSHFMLHMDEFDLKIRYAPDYPEEEYRFMVTASVAEREKFRPCLLYIGSGSGATVLEAMREACEDAKRMDYSEQAHRE